MTARLYIGDAFDRMAELEGPYELIVTSPPFLALRSYLPAGHPDKAKEIGSEATPAAFLDVMLALTAEWGRLLAPHGSIAIEIGDTYSGSGGGGGDYNADGLRAGQPVFDGSGRRVRETRREGYIANGITPPPRRDISDGWPDAKSLAMIPELYAASLAYGRNLLTGQPSPAGRWRVRNFKPWIRSNPPVGALGDKERPATSYVTVATRAVDRYFDLDAVRTQVAHAPHTDNRGGHVREGIGGRTRQTMNPVDENGHRIQSNAAGAPPLDWWHHVDAIIDDEIDQRAGKANGWSPGDKRTGKERSDSRGGNWSTFPDDGTPEARNLTVGARGVHIRRRLEAAGILATLDALDISPKGYAGAHYAVWPPELVKRLILEMCPRRVCTTCGKPSRRIVAPFTLDSYRSSTRPQTRKAIALADEHGLTDAHIAAIRAFGIGDAGKAPSVYNGAGRNSDDVKRLAAEAKAVLGGYFREFTQTTTAERSSTWSDCGHGTWRTGRILDPFTGSGTTLAVATGLGYDADGIDLDQRNADLAVERCGMFLEIHHPTQVVA